MAEEVRPYMYTHMRAREVDYGLSLRKRRTWYAEGSGQQAPPPGGSGAGDGSGLPEPEGAGDQQPPSGKTFTEEQVNNIVKQRLSDERRRTSGQYGDLTKLLEKAKAGEVSASVIADLQSKIEQYQRKEQKIDVAIEAGIPISIAGAIEGTTRDDMLRHAKQIQQDLRIASQPPPPQLDPFAGQLEGQKRAPSMSREEKGVAVKFGMTDAEYLANKKKLEGG